MHQSGAKINYLTSVTKLKYQSGDLSGKAQSNYLNTTIKEKKMRNVWTYSHEDIIMFYVTKMIKVEVYTAPVSAASDACGTSL